MSHLHLPDGILPLWLIITGFIIAGLILTISLWQLKKEKNFTKYSLIGFFAALMLIGMTLEIIPLGYHINLAVPTGIVVGPFFGFIAAFIVNIFLALFGHGGITVIGLNALAIGAEAVIGFYIFYTFYKIIPNRFWSGFLATIIALAISTTISFGIIVIGTPDFSQAVEQKGNGFIGFELLPKDEPEETDQEKINLTRLAILMFGLGAIGWVIEGTIAGLLLSYIAKIKPEVFKKSVNQLNS